MRNRPALIVALLLLAALVQAAVAVRDRDPLNAAAAIGLVLAAALGHLARRPRC